MITTVNLLIVGIGLFSYFSFTHPEPCPKKYRVLQENGGELENLGDIHIYCNLEKQGGYIVYTLKEKYEE